MRRASVGGGLVLAGLLLSACSTTCGATKERLAALRPGMTYAETAVVLGCPGLLVAGARPDFGGASAIVWDGPDSLLFTRTQVEFLDDRLLWYSTVSRGGY